MSICNRLDSESLRILIDYAQKPKDVNMLPVGFRITKDLDQVCPKTSLALAVNLNFTFQGVVIK